MHHGFDVEIAMVVGVNAAIMFDCIYHWCLHNQANGVNFRDGHYWTYNSMKAFSELMPYWTERQIKSAIAKLKENELILTDNYNDNARDRTAWYTVSEKSISIVQKCTMQSTKTSNASDKNVQCSYYTTNTTTNKHIMGFKVQKCPMGKMPPTLEEVAEYCKERKNGIDPEYFFNFYEANGWVQGKGKPIKSWKSAIITWEKMHKNKTTSKKFDMPLTQDDADFINAFDFEG